MELKVKICTDDSCKVIVKDETTDYLAEGSTVTVKGQFKYSDTVTIDLLQHNKVDGPELQTPTYTVHTDEVKSITLPVLQDGWFSVVHIVVPSKDWVENEYAKELHGSLPLYKIVYFSDGQQLYKIVDNGNNKLEYSGVPLEEVVEVNTVDTTISRIESDYVSICFLQQCYISLCQQIFNTRGFAKCWDKNNVDSELIYRRDLVWMTINVVKYLVEFKQLAETERILNSIGGCNGLCKSEFKQLAHSGCGCSK